jgi:hypothetical protein
MGFGAIVTSGEDYLPLPDDLTRWIVEARVEMELSRASRFAVRFEDDVCDGEFAIARRPQLQPNQRIGIFVAVAGEPVPQCLCVGPITRIRTSAMVGGTGSWLEVHGEDRRVEMGRVGIQDSWIGRASDAARSVLSAYDFEAEVDETRIVYADEQHALNQRGTDLAFIDDIARKNNLEFWLTYNTVATPRGPTVAAITAHLQASPSRPAAGPPRPPVLTADEGLVIDVMPPPGSCVSVTRFDVRIDTERPSAARGFARAMDSGEATTTESTAPDAPLSPDAATIELLPRPSRRSLASSELAPTVTDPVEQALAAEAQLTEAAWFVEVDCSTTMRSIGSLVLPHRIVDVRHAGPRLSGPYQVKSATHVINATDHLIDFKLRANGLAAGSLTP